MKKVFFSGACIDENGKASGGKAGDQTRKEIRTTSAYQLAKGMRVFRCPNANTAYWIGTNAYNIAANNLYGYDQSQRDTGYNLAKAAGWEPRKVNQACELDCSSMVRTCVACALEKDIPNFNTVTEPNVLLGLGFKEIVITSFEQLQLGDILCTPTKGHTEIVSMVVEDSEYYSKCGAINKSITKALAEVGEKDTSLSHRKKISVANGITNSTLTYVGTASQNTKMLNLLKQGKLKKA